jgi:hypothetical protein
MSENVLHETLCQTLAAMGGQDVDVRQVRECGLVRYDPSKADLLRLQENPKTE